MTDQTDEDKMMERLLIHKNMIGWLIKKLKAEGIECQRTTGLYLFLSLIFFNFGQI